MSKMTDTYYKHLDLMDGMERELYRILKTFKDNVTHQAFPSISTLLRLFKRSRNTTKKYLRILQAKGFIHIKEQKVKHPVTNNKYNDTNLYTLLLDKYNKVTPAADAEREIEILKEPKLDTIISNLKTKYNGCVVDSAVKAMQRNMRNGFVVKHKQPYLTSIITIADEQLNEVNKAVEAIDNQSKNNTESKPKKQYKSKNKNSNFNFKATKTKFHNFKQRTDNYTAEELSEMIMSKAKRKSDKQCKSLESDDNIILGLSGIIDHSSK